MKALRIAAHLVETLANLLIAGGRIASEWTAQADAPRFDLNALHDGFAGVR